MKALPYGGKPAGRPSLPAGHRAQIPSSPLERLVRKGYARIDAAAGRELDRLLRAEAIAASCRRGCSSCCGQHIQTNPVEAHALGRYVRRNFSVRQIGNLRRRTERWHAWHAARRNGDYRPDPAADRFLSGYEPFCPLLVNRACSAYPVRPAICRTHFVSSDPRDCRPAHDERPAGRDATVIASVLHATQPLSLPVRAAIEAQGLDFSRSILLLPHWLAIEMGWEFDGES
jgi:Fe-S-cluster containining protein